MDRRIALKNMGLALGYTVATPTIISLMQSCAQDTAPQWTPAFFSPEEGVVLMQLADLILPKTDTPSATEVGVHRFLDRYVSEVSDRPEQIFSVWSEMPHAAEIQHFAPTIVSRMFADTNR